MPIEATVFKCQHCGSKYIRHSRKAVEQHERWCYKRPGIFPACWRGCENYTYIKSEPNGIGLDAIYHICSVRGDPMESFKTRVKNKAEGTSSGYRVMPSRCPDFTWCGKRFGYPNETLQEMWRGETC